LIITSTTPVANLSIGGNAATATRATNIAGGLIGQIPYQSAVNTTALLVAGTAGQVLTSGGAGAPTWTTPTTGTVTSVSGTAPVVSSGGNTPAISMAAATSLVPGYLTSADWSNFNSKESVLTFSTGLTRTTNTITSNLSTGIIGGQSVIGGTAAGNNLTLLSTSNATKGLIQFGTSAYNEVNNRLGIGTTAPTAPLDVVGDVHISATGSGRSDVGSPNPPREIGITNWADGNGARYTFGDAWNALQNAWGYRMQLTAYWGVNISGNTENSAAIPFIVGAATDASLNVIGTSAVAAAGAPVLTATAGSQSGNLQEWRNSGGTALASVSSAGKISTSGGATINGAFNYGIDAGATDDYVITLNPAPTAYVAGMMIAFYANTPNTLGCTINVNGLGPKSILKKVNTVLATNDILGGMVCLLIYDGTNFKIMNPIVP
jgi:hypothetical protein